MASPDQSPSWDRQVRCVCKGCTVAREQGASDLIEVIKKLHKDAGDGCCVQCAKKYPCPTIKTIESI